MKFTQHNTDGYSSADLDKLNAELSERLQDVDPGDLDQIDFIEKSFADEVARR